MVSQLFLAVEGLYSCSSIQIIAVSAFNLPLLIYTIILRANGWDAFYNTQTRTIGPRICETPAECSEAGNAAYGDCLIYMTALPVVSRRDFSPSVNRAEFS